MVDESTSTEPWGNPEQGSQDTSKSPHVLPMEPRGKVEAGSGKHSVYTQFPKDPNCDICLKTKITRASCRRRAGTVVPRAEHFGDLITADHKILSEGSESRNNHRYAVVVQDLATQWIQSHPWKSKSAQETQKNLMKFLEPTRKPKVIYTDNSVEFGKSCEESSWNYCTSTPHRSETHGIAERAVRRVKEGTSAVLLQSVWTTNGGRTLWNATAICETCKISCLMGRHPMKGGSECPLTDQQYRLEQWSNITLFLRKTKLDCISLEQKSCQVFSSGMHYLLEESGKETFWSQTLIEELEEMDASELHARRLNAKEVLTPMKR